MREDGHSGMCSRVRGLHKDFGARGEAYHGSGLRLRIESGVRLLGVTDLVSEDLLLVFFEVDWDSQVPRGGSPSALPASDEAKNVNNPNQAQHVSNLGLWNRNIAVESLLEEELVDRIPQ